MMLREKIDRYLKEILELENSFRQAQGMEMLPLSFFSSSFDILQRLKTGIFEIEEIQLQLMQEHLKNNRNEWLDADETGDAAKSTESEVFEAKVKTTPAVAVLADAFEQKAGNISVNDRFSRKPLNNRLA